MAARTLRAAGSLWRHMDLLPLQLPQQLTVSSYTHTLHALLSRARRGKVKGPGRESLAFCAITASLAFWLSHGSMQNSPPSFHIWWCSGIWQASAPSVLRQGGWRCTCMWCQLLALEGREGQRRALLPAGLLLGSVFKVKIT